jgi:transcriptional regulator with XRE-family HTH domain
LSQRTSLGNIIRRIRSERDWTLAEMSAVVGIPVSTLAKIEHDRLSLTYDKLLRLSERLGIGLPELFAMTPVPETPVATGRRSIVGETNSITVVSRNYDDKYLCSELRKKIITPIIVDVKASSIEEFGPLITHDGEEFLYVISGSIVVHTSFYEPTEVKTGGGHYLDSQMGHAYVRAAGYDSATILVVCASKSEGLNQALIEQMIGFAKETDQADTPRPDMRGEGKGGNRPRSGSHPPGRTRARSARR